MNNLNTVSLIGVEVLTNTLFPVDLIPIDASKKYEFDAKGVPCFTEGLMYHPTIIGHYALSRWNEYCKTQHTSDREMFLMQVQWFIEHEVVIGDASSGWPISFPHPGVKYGGVWLSAVTQGCAISVLARAYYLTHEQRLLEMMQRVLHSFEQDILDGGVKTPIGKQGIFFEEMGVYPASHNLAGGTFAILCLYNYELLMNDRQMNTLVQSALATLQKVLPEFDTGFWTYTDLLQRRLSSPTELALHIKLLRALIERTHCAHCTPVLARWEKYHVSLSHRLYRSVVDCWTTCSDTIWRSLQARLFPKNSLSSALRVCVAVPAFPVPGGVLTVLEGIAHVTKDIWHIEYVTNHVGPRPENHVIHPFGTKKMGYWQFPMVWFHVLAGCRKLLSLMYHGSSFHIFLPQDGVFTGALAALAGRLTGKRVVCVDHGHLTLLKSKTYRAERVKILEGRAWYRRLLSRFLYMFYWPALVLCARIAARLTDYYLVPGLAGDGVEEVCKQLGVPPSRLVRFASMVHIENHPVLDSITRAEIRTSKNLPADAIVIAIVCRLAPEKGLGVALESISIALARSLALKERVRVVIAGDGPLRQQIEDDVERFGLRQTCIFLGDITQREVFTLLAWTYFYTPVSVGHVSQWLY